jgi:hypothetical protein
VRTGGKLLAAGGTLAAIVALSPVGAALGRGQANTQVTIQGGGGLVEGEVKSPDENHCANQRKVLIFKVTNGNAERVASDRATQNGDRYQWGKGFDGGKYFAKVKATDQCKGDSTKTVNAGHL